MNRQKDYRERKRNMKRKRDICSRDIDREREKIRQICSVQRERYRYKEKQRYIEKNQRKERYIHCDAIRLKQLEN